MMQRPGNLGSGSGRESGLQMQTRWDALAAPVWWRIADGVVHFDEPDGRWWIAGADVDEYECF